MENWSRRGGGTETTVGFTNLIMQPGRTREAHHRDDRDVGHELRPTPSPATPAVAPGGVANWPALDVAGACYNVPRKRRGPAQDAAPSGSAASRDTLTERCARTAP